MASFFKQIAVCVFYGLASCSLSFLNKTLFNVHNYKFPNMVIENQILFAQFVFGVVFTILFKIIRPSGIPKIWAVPKFSIEMVTRCWILSVTFLANVMCGIFALSRVNIPVFLAFRRLTTSFIFFADVLVLKKKVSLPEKIGVAAITIGAVLAGVFLIQINDLKADLIGYVFIILNNLITTVHFNAIKKHSEKNPDIDSATSSFYMSTLSIPVLFLLSQYESAEAFDLFNRSNSFYLIYLLSLSAGIVLTFSQNLCTTVNSPIATSITGNVKDILLTFASFIIFDDIFPTFWLVVGLVLSLAGAFVYSLPKLQRENKKDQINQKGLR